MLGVSLLGVLKHVKLVNFRAAGCHFCSHLGNRSQETAIEIAPHGHFNFPLMVELNNPGILLTSYFGVVVYQSLWGVLSALNVFLFEDFGSVVI